MILSELLASINGGGYLLSVKFNNGYKWSAFISTDMNLKHEQNKFMQWNFGAKGYAAAMQQPVECLQIIVNDDDNSKNRLYVKLGGTQSKETSTYAKNIFVSGNVTCIDSIANSMMLIDHQTGKYDSAVLSRAIITFPDHDSFLHSEAILYFSETGSVDDNEPISAINTPIMDLPEIFKKEKIEKLPIKEYMQKYKTKEGIANMIQVLGSKESPTLDDYNLLKISNADKDSWMSTPIESMPVSTNHRIAILTWLSKYLKTTSDIDEAFRWNMRGLPLEQCIRRQWALHEYKWLKEHPDGTRPKEKELDITDDDLPF